MPVLPAWDRWLDAKMAHCIHQGLARYWVPWIFRKGWDALGTGLAVPALPSCLGTLARRQDGPLHPLRPGSVPGSLDFPQRLGLDWVRLVDCPVASPPHLGPVAWTSAVLRIESPQASASVHFHDASHPPVVRIEPLLASGEFSRHVASPLDLVCSASRAVDCRVPGPASAVPRLVDWRVSSSCWSGSLGSFEQLGRPPWKSKPPTNPPPRPAVTMFGRPPGCRGAMGAWRAGVDLVMPLPPREKPAQWDVVALPSAPSLLE